MPGVEAGRSGLDLQNVDVEGEAVVQTVLDRERRHRLLRLQVGDLGERMHARVRPPGSAERRVLPEELPRRPQEDTGNRSLGVLLRLPAAVARPVVLERELPGRHARTLSKRAAPSVPAPGGDEIVDPGTNEAPPQTDEGIDEAGESARGCFVSNNPP